MNSEAFDLFTYPEYPGSKRRDTAHRAAEQISRKAPLWQMCLDHLRVYGELTADETASGLRMDKLSIRPRFSELAALGSIEDTGFRRPNSSGKSAIVWRLIRQRLAA